MRTRSALLSAVLLFAVLSPAYAADITWTYSPTASTTNEQTIAGITITPTYHWKATPYAANSSGMLQIGSSGKNATSVQYDFSAFPAKIKSVIVTGRTAAGNNGYTTVSGSIGTDPLDGSASLTNAEGSVTLTPSTDTQSGTLSLTISNPKGDSNNSNSQAIYLRSIVVVYQNPNDAGLDPGLEWATIFDEQFSGMTSTTSWGSQTKILSSEGNLDVSLTDRDSWYGNTLYNAPSAPRLGNGSNHGWVQSPPIELSNDVSSATVKVTFSAIALAASAASALKFSVLDANGEILSIAGVSPVTPTLPVVTSPTVGSTVAAELAGVGGSAQTFTFTAPAGFKLKFDASTAGNSNVALDDILVEQVIDPLFAPLAAPTGVTSNNVEKFSFTVAWGTVANAAGYEVWLDDAPIGICDTTSTNLTGLTAGTPYKVQVRAKGDNLHYGDSPLSSAITVTTQADAQKIDFTVTGAPEAPVYTGDPVAFTVTAENESTHAAAEVSFFGIAGATFAAATGAFAWTPTENDVGSNVATFTSGAYSTNVTIEVLSTSVTTNLFHETFAGCVTKWNNSAAMPANGTTNTTTYVVEDGWNFAHCYRGESGLKMGTENVFGTATTRAIVPTTPGTVSLSFRAAACLGKTGELTVTAAGGASWSQTVSLTAMTNAAEALPAGADYEFAYDIPVTDAFTLTFTPASGDGRMGVDDILVRQTTPARIVALPAPAPAFDETRTTVSSLVAEWTAVADAEGYGVRLLDAETGDVVQTIASQAATSATFTGLAAYHEYVASVRALGDGTATASSPWAQSAAARTSVDVNAPVFAASEGAGDAVMATAEKRFSVTATRDGDPVAVSYAGLAPAASGATWSSPWFSWTPTDADAGSYTARFTTDNGAYSTNIAFTVTARPALADPVVTNTVAGVKNASFLWDVVPQPRAASYAVRLWRGVADYRNPVCFEDFGDGGSMPDGWSGTDTEWYTKGGYESSRVKFVKDGATLVSKLHSAPVTNLTFHTRSSSTSATSTLKLYASTGGTGEQDWSFISSQTISTGVQSESFPDSLGYRRFKWVFAKGTGTLGLGDIAAAHEGASAIFTLGTAESAVDLGTSRSLDVSNLRAGRDYFLEVTVTGDDGTTTKSSVLRFATKPAHKATVFIVR